LDQSIRQSLDQRVAILRTVCALLLILRDVEADQPVAQGEAGVDRPRSLRQMASVLLIDTPARRP